MSLIVSRYLAIVRKLLERIALEEAPAIERASDMIVETYLAGGVLHVVGAGHSSIVGEEMFYRAGGLAFVNPLVDSDISVHRGARRASALEKLAGYAEALLRSQGLRKGDAVLVVSTSGVNTFPVEAAVYARGEGCGVIAVTSKSYSASLKPRNPYGKRLYEVADVAVDNKVPPGDAALEVEGLPVKVAPVSTITNSFIVHSISALAAKKLAERGVEPPIWVSIHLPGGKEHNASMIDKYRARIRLL
ncbi:MAG: SIS domain-containing protein [Candidatus Korarchaeota archaeon]|nr:SIS domain-containing protein [Candidatus Korarchaeota archaeon]